MNQNPITIIGLTINLIGAIFLAFSFSPTEKVGKHTADNGKTTDFILPNFHKWKFKLGITLMIIGFVFQIIAIL